MAIFVHHPKVHIFVLKEKIYCINYFKYFCSVVGKHGIICMEDLIHQIFTVGPRFRQVNNFLWPFKLSCPRGGYRKKGNHFVEGGDFGNREDLINMLIQRMN